MNVAGSLFWACIVATVAVFALAQVVHNDVRRSTLIAVALVALITSGLMGAAWVTTSG